MIFTFDKKLYFLTIIFSPKCSESSLLDDIVKSITIVRSNSSFYIARHSAGARKTFNQNAIVPTRPINVDIIRRIKIRNWPINEYARVIATYNNDRHRHGIFPRQNKHNVTFRSDTMSPVWETNLRRSIPNVIRTCARVFVQSYSPFFFPVRTVLCGCSSSSRRQMLPEILPPPPPPSFRASRTKGRPKPFVRRRSSVIVRWRRGWQRVGTRYPENIGNLSGLLCYSTSACSICFFCFYLRMDERASETANFGSITSCCASVIR